MEISNDEVKKEAVLNALKRQREFELHGYWLLEVHHGKENII